MQIQERQQEKNENVDAEEYRERFVSAVSSWLRVRKLIVSLVPVSYIVHHALVQ
jgi:hypothetical protein